MANRAGLDRRQNGEVSCGGGEKSASVDWAVSAVNGVTVRRRHAHLFSSGVTSPPLIVRRPPVPRTPWPASRRRIWRPAPRRNRIIPVAPACPTRGPTPPIALRPGASICRAVERIGTTSDAEEWATLFAVVVRFGLELISIRLHLEYINPILNVEFKRQTLYSKTGQRGVKKYILQQKMKRFEVYFWRNGKCFQFCYENTSSKTSKLNRWWAFNKTASVCGGLWSAVQTYPQNYYIHTYVCVFSCDVKCYIFMKLFYDGIKMNEWMNLSIRYNTVMCSLWWFVKSKTSSKARWLLHYIRLHTNWWRPL